VVKVRSGGGDGGGRAGRQREIDYRDEYKK
jgi:hypothetical protein